MVVGFMRGMQQRPITTTIVNAAAAAVSALYQLWLPSPVGLALARASSRCVGGLSGVNKKSQARLCGETSMYRVEDDVD